jgi:hypothetical protein
MGEMAGRPGRADWRQTSGGDDDDGLKSVTLSLATHLDRRCLVLGLRPLRPALLRRPHHPRRALAQYLAVAPTLSPSPFVTCPTACAAICELRVVDLFRRRIILCSAISVLRSRARLGEYMAHGINTVFVLPVAVECVDTVQYAACGRKGRSGFEIGVAM